MYVRTCVSVRFLYVMVPSYSLLEKQGIDFVKTQEEEVEKEFEEMRVSQYSVLNTYTYTCVHVYNTLLHCTLYIQRG